MTNNYALHAWVDESMHVDGDDGLYVLAAVVCEAGSCDPIRDTMRSLLDTGQPKLHWGTESPERREKIISTVAQIDMAAVVVIGTPLTKRKQERARAVCMESLAVHLAKMDVTHVLLEERTPSLNERDMKIVRAMRGSKLIPPQMRIDVQRPSVEPMLWIPDAVAGAVGADRRRRNPRYLDMIRSTLTELEIPLR